MASSTDRSADRLPRPELNPLQNPVLADNMGRWAEVYFTSAPEKREKAVLELLRELEADDAERACTAEVARSAATKLMEVPVSESAVVERESIMTDMRQCGTCGHRNPVVHQFCGMCGTPMGGSTSTTQYERAQPSVDEELRSEYREPGNEEALSPEDTRRDPYDLSLFQSFRPLEVGPDFEYEESPSARYRYYIGLVLAILILGLGYVAWRGSQENQNTQGAPPPPPPAATDKAPVRSNQNSAASVPSSTEKPVPPQPPSAVKSIPQQAASTPAPAHKPPTPASSAKSAPASSPLPAPRAAVGTGQQESAAEELAMAQRYLTGHPRNSKEAATWLWKAIADHNGPAMVALADLYLKGDGVSKNCDQARVLLDSAARQGVAGAGQRLRHLPAFGCR